MPPTTKFRAGDKSSRKRDKLLSSVQKDDILAMDSPIILKLKIPPPINNTEGGAGGAGGAPPAMVLKLRSPLMHTMSLPVDGSPLIAIHFPRFFDKKCDRLTSVEYMKNTLKNEIFELIHACCRGLEIGKWNRFEMADWFSLSTAFFTSARKEEAISMTGVSKEAIEELSWSGLVPEETKGIFIAVIDSSARPTGKTDPPFLKTESKFIRIIESNLFNDSWIRTNLEINTGRVYILAGFTHDTDAFKWAYGKY